MKRKPKKGCKQLNYEEKDGYKHWRWPIFIDGDIADVQFCRKRGKINDIFSCYNPHERSCFEKDEE